MDNLKTNTTVNSTTTDGVILENNTGMHSVNIFSGSYLGPDRKYHGGREVAVIPMGGKPYSIFEEKVVVAVSIVDGYEVPIVERHVTGADMVPDDGRIHIVSAIYAAGVAELARRARKAGIVGGDYEQILNRIVTIGDPVVEETEPGRYRTLGCCRLVRWNCEI